MAIPNFKLYSSYYDLLYEDKDYRSEAGYINLHLKQLVPEAKEILELGCGTGNHARYLTTYGYKVTGIERSAEMLQQARSKSIKGFQPVLADICSFKLEHQFDAAISLFHSLCYLTTNDELLAAFGTVSNHLRAGGIFAFDCWFAPAVLHHLPVSKTKHKQNELMEVTRYGETTMFIERNIAEVNYEIIVKDKASNEVIEIKEKHPMRYFSIPEIALIAKHTGFDIIRVEEFLTSDQPTFESWSIFVVLRKK